MKLWNESENKSVKEKLDTVSVAELLENEFYIPDYQRGYRWTAFEVTKLLEDFQEYINSFDNKNPHFYCMQPLVVFYNKQRKAWEVIDGQQRLTTLFLILKTKLNVFKDEYSGFDLYKLSYQSREGSAEYLKTIDEDKKKLNIDYFHIFNAFETIKSWLKDVDGIRYVTSILNVKDEKSSPKVKFIWYDVTEEIEKEKISSEKVFSRLNIGKIGLTNAELIKALFLNRVEKENESIDDPKIRAKIVDSQKSKIAVEWDMVEHSLHDPELWSFIYGKGDGSEKYSTRIEFLFDILQEKDLSRHSAYYTFDKYVNLFKECDANELNVEEFGVIPKWKELMDLFYVMKNWNENHELFHVIGFLRYKGVGIGEILQILKSSKSNDDFKLLLREKIKSLMKSEIENLRGLNYLESTRSQLLSTLLLHNVMTVVNCKKGDVKFSFKDFYSKDWDLEHVRSQTPKNPSGDDRDNWIYTCLQYFSGISFESIKETVNQEEKDRLENKGENPAKKSALKKKIKEKYVETVCKEADSLKQEIIGEYNLWNDICEPLKNLLVSEIDVTKSDVYKVLQENIFKENTTFDDEHSISNLVLLDSTTNRSYGNAFFPIKRKVISMRERDGVYILPCTKNVFSKVYSEKLSDLMNWNKSDAENYMKEIEACLSSI